eukprot:scaffold32550_cov62-Isochrysis_galbana.AAC.1
MMAATAWVTATHPGADPEDTAWVTATLLGADPEDTGGGSSGGEAPAQPYFDFPCCNAFLRRCLYEAVEDAFPPNTHQGLVAESVLAGAPPPGTAGTTPSFGIAAAS